MRKLVVPVALSLCAIFLAEKSAAYPPGPQAQLAGPGYFSYPEIVDRIHQLEASHPEIAQAVDLNELLHTPLTAEAQPIWALKISDHVTEAEDEPAVVIDGLHHARELVTPHAVLDVAEVLTGRYGIDREVTAWVDHYELWLIPCMNPDGLKYVFEQNRSWRKNRRVNGDGSFGVDLNRNYPFGWGVCGGTSSGTRSDEYRGPEPKSESEVQTLLALGARVRPLLYLSYHSYGQQVLYPYRCADLAERESYYAIRDQYATAMRYGMRVASASGESFEHFYNQLGSMAFLTEIGAEFQPPFASVASILERIRTGWQYLLRRGMGASIQGHVTDGKTGDPVPSAAMRIESINFKEGEDRRSEPVFGRYQWILQPGTYKVHFEAPGFQSESRTITVQNSMTGLDVELLPVTTETSARSNRIPRFIAGAPFRTISRDRFPRRRSR